MSAAAALARSVRSWSDAKVSFREASRKRAETAKALFEACKDSAAAGEEALDVFDRLVRRQVFELVCNAHNLDASAMDLDMNRQHKTTWATNTAKFVSWHNENMMNPGDEPLTVADVESNSGRYKTSREAYSKNKTRIWRDVKAVERAFLEAAEKDSAHNLNTSADAIAGAGAAAGVGAGSSSKRVVRKKKKLRRGKSRGNLSLPRDSADTALASRSAAATYGKAGAWIADSAASSAKASSPLSKSGSKGGSKSGSKSGSAAKEPTDRDFAWATMQLSLYCSAKLGPACQAGLASATATAEEDSPIAASAAATKDLVGSDGVHSNAESTQVARVKWLQDLARLLKSMPPELRATIDQEMRQARTRVLFTCNRSVACISVTICSLPSQKCAAEGKQRWPRRCCC